MKLQEFLKLYPWKRDSGEYPAAHLYFTISLPAGRKDLWPVLADTSRLNRALGLGRRQEEERNGVLYVREKLRGLRLEWIEHPWSWLQESHAVLEREYTRGPFLHFRCVFHLLDNPEGGTLVCMHFAWICRNVFWSWLIQAIGPKLRRGTDRLLRKMSERITRPCSTPEPSPFFQPAPLTDASARMRLEEIESELLALPLEARVVRALVQHVAEGDEMDLYRLRPLKLARAWELDEQELLRACLHGTRAGLLNLSWDIICPHCRGVREEVASLSGIPRQGRCDICDIDFSVKDENSVEVTFQVHESIRRREKVLFCSAEPARKTHIRWQSTLSPGEQRAALFELAPGRYRLRELQAKNKLIVDVASGQGGLSTLAWDTLEPPAVPTQIDCRCGITVRNSADFPVCFVLEELWWERDLLRPGRLFCLPEFQQLFSRECLATGMQLDLGNQTILFTDIVGSTRFYHDVGDSTAFAAVVDHFDELAAIISRNGGAVIKTIGDAVMAAFHTPEHCLNACASAQKAFTAPGTKQKVRLRISVHHGPVIAVNWNTGRDFFGQVVNVAAKMQSCAGAGEVALSQEFTSLMPACPLLSRFPSRTMDLLLPGGMGASKVSVYDMSATTSNRASDAA